jgi:GR25 family glycosyltransferase involved in LPS biosynthesis
MLFDKIIYINLDRRPDRNKNMIELLHKYNLAHISQRFRAYDGRQLNLDNIDQSLITKQGINDATESNKLYTILTPGGIGCALSHHAIYKKIIDDNINACLILEDDVQFSDKFNAQLNILENIIKRDDIDYDLFFLGFTKSALNYKHSCKINRICSYSRIYGLFGYIVTNKGARKLLNIFPITKQIDTEISNHSDQIKILGLSYETSIIFSDQSSIHTKFGTDIQIRNDLLENKINDSKIIKNLYNIDVLNQYDQDLDQNSDQTNRKVIVIIIIVILFVLLLSIICYLIKKHIKSM